MKPIGFKDALDRMQSVPVILEANDKNVQKYLMYRGFAPKAVSSLFSWIRVVFPSTIAEDLIDFLGIEKYFVDYHMNIFATKKIETEKKIILPISFTSKALGMDEIYKLNLGDLTLNLTGKNVKVGVVDTGANHVFKKSIKTEASNILGMYDFNGHGTHVSATISAPFNAPKYGDIDMHGVAPDSKLYTYNAMPIGMANTSDIIKGIDALYKLGVRIFNLSLGQDIDSDYKYEEDAMVQYIDKMLAHDPNVMFCVASGNSGANVLSTPAISPNVLAVGSLSYTDREASFFSSSGEIDIPSGTRKIPDVVSYGGGRVDKDAKEELILSFTGANASDLTDGLQPNNFGLMQGTSQATPHVTGTIVLMYQLLRDLGLNKNVKFNATVIRDILKHNYSYDSRKGYGLMDAQKMINVFEHLILHIA